MATRTTLERQAAERIGRRAEALATLLLMVKGYRILARRYKSPVGEIDVIARRGSTLIFAEVKRRGREDDALIAVSATARRRIVRAADSFLARHPRLAGLTLRYDILIVGPRRLPIHRVNAFRADD